MMSTICVAAVADNIVIFLHAEVFAKRQNPTRSKQRRAGYKCTAEGSLNVRHNIRLYIG